jgi:hypothetical protein
MGLTRFMANIRINELNVSCAAGNKVVLRQLNQSREAFAARKDRQPMLYLEADLPKRVTRVLDDPTTRRPTKSAHLFLMMFSCEDCQLRGMEEHG